MIVAYTFEDEIEHIVYEKSGYFFEPPDWIMYAPSYLSFPLYMGWILTMGSIGLFWLLFLLAFVCISWPLRRPIQLLIDYIEEKIRRSREKKRLRREFLESLEGKIDIHYQP